MTGLEPVDIAGEVRHCPERSGATNVPSGEAAVDAIDVVKAAIAQSSAATGCPPENYLISATHTHSAPAAMGCLGARIDPAYASMDPEGDPVVFLRFTRQPAKGAVTLNPDGTFTYTPNTDLSGTDTLTVTVSDLGESGTGYLSRSDSLV
mgnify:CR=1 FL=1